MERSKNVPIYLSKLGVNHQCLARLLYYSCLYNPSFKSLLHNRNPQNVAGFFSWLYGVNYWGDWKMGENCVTEAFYVCLTLSQIGLI